MTRARFALFSAAVFLGPALLLWHLHRLWNPDGAYAYGWVAPVLAAYLFKSRWDDRPPQTPRLGVAGFLALAFALMTLPALWLFEAAPERSVCAWSYAVASIGIALSLMTLMGGWAWLRWFSFPLAFLLTTVPWPHTLETLITNPLMRGTAAATVEILCLIGVPSAQSGNLVHIETGVIDIDEACSGIRSLQAMAMIALFLGEMFRLKLASRLLLIGLGLAVTLLANVVRTVVLSSIGFHRGMAAVDHYHDAAGLTVLVFSMSTTLLAAFLLRPRKDEPAKPPASGSTLSTPLQLSFALLILLPIQELSVEAWYRFHAPKWQGWRWAVRWPQDSGSFRFKEIPKRSLRLLMCDESQAAEWKEADGSAWSAYWIRWNPGNPAAETAKVHRPDVCLNAEGAVMEKDAGLQVTSILGTQIAFHRYTFRLGEKTLYVFFCLSEEIPGESTIASTPEFGAVDIVQRALKGRRRIGLQSLELAASGFRSEQSAEEALKARLGEMMQIRQNAVASANSPCAVVGSVIRRPKTAPPASAMTAGD